MSDSPVPWVPLDPAEQPVLDKLLEVKAKLELLKQDRSTYVKTSEVFDLYKDIVEQVGILVRIREKKPIEQNKLDLVVDDCFQLLSLAFLTLGKCSEAPAVYSALSTIRRLLDHLNEAAFFSPKDLQSIRGKLKDYRQVIDDGQYSCCPNLLALMETRLAVCHQTLTHLETKLAPLTPELTPNFEKLVSISRCLSSLNLKPKFSVDEVNELHAQLKEIEKDLGVASADGHDFSEEYYWQKHKEYKESHEEKPTGRTLVLLTLTKCMLWVKIMRLRQGRINEPFKPTYDKLLSIRNHLEKLYLTRAWSLRETDLYSYQRELDAIDAKRVDGNFHDELGRPADLHDQRTMLHLIRKSYALIYLLIISSEPVSEALLPVYNQLLTTRKCMLEVQKHGGISTPHELYPYSMKLDSISKMRVDGKFKIGDDFPDGQDNVNKILTECFDIMNQLRLSASEPDKDNSETGTAPETVAIQS